MIKTKIPMLIIVALACGCDRNNLPQPAEEDKESVIMDNMEMVLHQTMKQCQNTDPQSIESLFQKLNNSDFLSQLDAPAVYNDLLIPPNLSKYLQRLAENTNQPAVVAGWGKLVGSPLYARNDAKGTLRRSALVIASGHLTQADKKILTFLENEVVIDDEKRALAVYSLLEIGTPESVSIVSRHIFNSQTSVVPEHLRWVFLPEYTMMMAEFRDHPAVLSFMLDQLYRTELRSEVLLCLIEDRIERNSNPAFHIIGAPLNEKTANSVAMAKMIAVWLIKNSPDLEEDEFEPIAKRVPDLLGIENAPTPTQEGLAIKKWASSLFQQAWKQTDDSERKQQLQLSLAAFQ